MNPIFEKRKGKLNLEVVASYKVTWPSGTSSKYSSLKNAIKGMASSITNNLIRTSYTRPTKMALKYWNKQNDPARIAWHNYCDGLTAKAERRLLRALTQV